LGVRIAAAIAFAAGAVWICDLLLAEEKGSVFVGRKIDSAIAALVVWR
jgi:hypothetical protein